MSDSTHRPFRRSRRRRWIAGICGAFAQRWGWRPGVVRLLFVLASALPGLPGLPIYLLLWLLTPLEEPEEPEPLSSPTPAGS